MRAQTTSAGATNTEYIDATNVTAATNTSGWQAQLDKALERWKKYAIHEQGMALSSNKMSFDLVHALWPTLIELHRDIVVRTRDTPSWFLLGRWHELTLNQRRFCAVFHRRMFEQVPKKHLPEFLVSPIPSVRHLAIDRYTELGGDE